MAEKSEKTMPAQKQDRQPGLESKMTPKPQADDPRYRGTGKLQGKVALITGGDSGIGRAVAIAFAKEGADVAINYLEEDKDAKETQQMVEEHGRNCVLLPGDVGDEKTARRIVDKAVKELGKLDVLVNNASEQHPQESIEDITAEQLERTFRTNVFGYFFMTKAAMKHLREGSCIINTVSVTAYKG
ncbi:MAG: SDR family NAD(P)-dependent oxidoreductase, partial [Acidobacteriota bacterium]|nr:SDR family NAD(P)-dependent oxidoreductase [Acidobacteriota bacterium]